jgi:hypothetical protein
VNKTPLRMLETLTEDLSLADLQVVELVSTHFQP